MMKKLYVTAALAAFASACASSGSADNGSKAAASQPAAAAAAATGDIVDVAVGAGSFETLVAALQAAGLVDALKGDGPFTVFAPTDEAFAALPDGTLDTLLEPENVGQLQDILKYHVVAGKVMAADVTSLSSADTLLGKPLNISTKDGMVKINDATVVKADVGASNGVIHVVDTVILPN